MALDHVATDHVTKQRPAVRMALEGGGVLGEAKREEGKLSLLSFKNMGSFLLTCNQRC